MYGQPFKEENYVARVKAEYPNDLDEVLKLYPHGSNQKLKCRQVKWPPTALLPTVPGNGFDLHRNNSEPPVYRYLYSKLRPPLVNAFLSAGLAGGTVQADPNAPKPPAALGAPHACEIEYCMGNLPLVKQYAWTADDFKVSETMFTYFANFIKTGNPNDGKLPDWPAAKTGNATPPVMVLDTQSKSVNAANDARYEFLDKAFKNK